jgi:hypothetical protein
MTGFTNDINVADDAELGPQLDQPRRHDNMGPQPILILQRK